MKGRDWRSPALVVGLSGLLLASPATVVLAQDHSDHRHHAPAAAQDRAGHDAHAHGQHDTIVDDAATAPREPIPEVTEADRAAAFPALAHHMEHAPGLHWKVLFNRLEATETNHGNGQAWEGSAWIGGDTRRLWLRSEGERASGRTESADIELLYGRSVSPWWDVVAGVRHDVLPRDGRTWAAVGVQGMAPYRFEVSATAYAGASGRTAASIELEYDMLLTNRLILQPLIEATWHGKDDPAHGIGHGLSSVEAGLRMRYEVTRRFAPYIGYARSQAYGGTADYRRAQGEPASEHGWVAGFRIWF